MQAEAGYFTLTGEPDMPPTRFGLSIVDMITGLGMAYALVAGLVSARETGRGRDIDVSLFDFALFNLSYVGNWFLGAGHVQGREPRSAHPSLTPCALYKTRDGWIYLMCNKEKFWGVLCRCIGRPELADDPRLRTFKDRLANRLLVTELLDEALSARTTAEWLEVLGGQVPAAPVLDVRQALTNPFVTESHRIEELESNDGVPLRLLAGPVRCPGETPPRRPGPKLGADTDDVLRSAGYDEERIEALRRRRVI